MVEWSIAAVLKTVETRVSGGSNPSLCAKIKERATIRSFIFCNGYREGFEGGSRFARAKRFANESQINDKTHGKGN